MTTDAPNAPAHPLDRYRDLLGTVPDSVVAAMADVARTTVVEYRKRLGIERYVRPQSSSTPAPAVRPPPVRPRDRKPAPGHRFYSGKLDAVRHLMGVQPDAEVAAAAKATVAGVRAYRIRHGIGPQPKPDERQRQQRFNRVKLDDFRHLMGVKTDAEVAEIASSSWESVKAYRKRHGIAAVAQAQSAGAGGPPKPRGRGRPLGSRLDAHLDIVGVLYDGAVAKIVGMSREGVRRFRARRGIPGGQFETLPGAAGVVVEAPVAPQGVAAVTSPAVVSPVVAEPARVRAPTAQHAFCIYAEAGGEQHRFTVAGQHIAEASRRAVSALAHREGGPWTIRRVKLLELVLG